METGSSMFRRTCYVAQRVEEGHGQECAKAVISARNLCGHQSEQRRMLLNDPAGSAAWSQHQAVSDASAMG